VNYEKLPRYSSADGDNYFGWANMKPKTPLILAKRFVVEFPKFAEPGHHREAFAAGSRHQPADQRSRFTQPSSVS
jgi:hypothetical protein